MSDELGAAIRTLQVGEEATAQQAFAAIADSVWREPEDGAAALQQAVLAEAAAGGLRTPRLLTLLGLAPAPAPACLPVCLALLRAA
ncbi:MAG: hypothetical protein Q7T97_05430, partial [Burkholderiaceae bacterium]|nr:hypothetical protein [Burkholderiaceae bacterium]